MQKANVDSSYTTNFRARVSAMMLLFSSLLLSTVGQAAYSVGVLKFAYGDVTITSSSGDTRKAVKDEDLMKDELIVTGAASFAVIQLNDDSRMTLRPYSRFRVTQLVMDDNGNDSSSQSAILNLLRGGLRLVTGLIGKANPTGYQLNTPVATIGIRGTEFNARICGTDCAAEEKRHADSDAAEKIKDGLYVNVDEGQVFLQNFAVGEPLDLRQGESGYVSDLNSLPLKLSFIPAFLSLDKLPSPSQLDFDDIEISDDELEEIENAAEERTDSANKEEATGLNIAGDWETDDVEYGLDLPQAAKYYFFGNNADLEFTLSQKGNKFEGEFEGDRDGVIKGEIDDDKVTFTFLLEAKRGELKEGTGFWIMQDDGSLEGEFQINDREHGIVRGFWTLERD
jgi:hypothetical protein